MSEVAKLHTQSTEHFDVLIVGAGISGVGAAHHLSEKCPDKSYVILEGKESFGGTWLHHTYPGIRSDSDLYTFGYAHKPWMGKPVAEADAILEYMGEAIEDEKIDEHIRYQHHVLSASWSSTDQRWLIEARRKDADEIVHLTCNFLWMCQGYYSFDKGYTPEWEGMAEFGGPIVHPQDWPEDFDYKGSFVLKRVISLQTNFLWALT